MKYLTLLVLIIALPSFARGRAVHRSCLAEANTQTQMDVCTASELKSADSALNASYRKLLSEVAGNKLAISNIRAAERAWVAYRDAYMNAMYPAKDKQAEYGSIYPMESSLLRAKLTRRHLDELNDLIKQYGPETH